MKEKKINWLKVLEYSLPALFSIFIFVFAMIVKGIYPFGANNIGYIDYNEQLVPFYTNLYDMFHGTANNFVDFNLGAGGSIVTSFVLNGFLSPLSWLIALFPREKIIFAISFLMIVKLALMATTAYIAFKYYFKNVNNWILLLFSLVWTFSGWTLIHFTNIGWLDLMTLFPLLIMAAKPLVEKGKNLWFVLCLTYMLCLSYYISYMVLVGVVVVALYYVIFMAKEKKKTASSLFFAIIISILMSFVAFIPSCLTSLQAHRFSGGASETASDLFRYFFSKVVVVFMFALPFVFFIRLMFKIKEDKKSVLFFMLSFITLSIGILIEPINKMWHTGSYSCYPIRYAFVIIMLVIFGALYYINKFMIQKEEPAEAPANKPEEKTNKKCDNRTSPLVYILCPTLFLCYLTMQIIVTCNGIAQHPYRQVTFFYFLLIMTIFALTYALIELLMRIKTKKLKLGNLNGGILIFVLVVSQLMLGMIGYAGTGYSKNTSRITNVYNLNLSKLDNSYKIKDRDYLYNDNFASITQFPTLQTWIHISSEEQFQGYDKLGLNTFSFELRSSGSTFITDILLGNKYVLSNEELNPLYYTKLNEFDYEYEKRNQESQKVEYTNIKVYLYELNFKMSKVLLTDVDLSELLKEKTTYFDDQNTLFKAIYGEDFDILTKHNLTVSEDDEFIYISASGLPRGHEAYISVDSLNGSYGPVIENDPVEKSLNVGINDLGELDSDELTIKIEKAKSPTITKELVEENFKLATFDIARFKQINDQVEQNDSDIEFKGNKLVVSVNNTSNKKYAFVPYTYLKNMNAKVNDKAADVNIAFSSFMMVNLEEGENQITITYEPQYLKLCAIVSAVALLIFILFAILNYKFNLASKKFVIWTGFIGACIILAAVGFLVYLKPFATFFITLFKG